MRYFFTLQKKEISSAGLDLLWHSTYYLNIYQPPLFTVFQLRMKKPPNALVALPILSWSVKSVDHAGGELWLLDIASIESGKNSDLCSYHYLLQPEKSFVICSKSSPPMLFEVMTEQERDRIILGLRYIVWKFTSHAVVGQKFFGVITPEDDTWESDTLIHTLLDCLKNNPQQAG